MGETNIKSLNDRGMVGTLANHETKYNVDVTEGKRYER